MSYKNNKKPTRPWLFQGIKMLISVVKLGILTLQPIKTDSFLETASSSNLSICNYVFLYLFHLCRLLLLHTYSAEVYVRLSAAVQFSMAVQEKMMRGTLCVGYSRKLLCFFLVINV